MTAIERLLAETDRMIDNEHIDKDKALTAERAEWERMVAEVARMREALEVVAKLVIIPPYMTEQARQMMRLQDMARAALKGDTR